MWSWLIRVFGFHPAAMTASPPRPIEADDWAGTILSAEEYR